MKRIKKQDCGNFGWCGLPGRCSRHPLSGRAERGRIIEPTPEDEQARLDFIEVLKKYQHMDAERLLALCSQLVGQCIALQDQRTMTPARAMKIVQANIELGNATVVEGLLKPQGSG